MRDLLYALIVVPLLLMISIAIFSNFGSSIDDIAASSGWSATANTTLDSVESGTWSGFSLGSMLPFILISVVIVSIILGAFGLQRVFG